MNVLFLLMYNFQQKVKRVTVERTEADALKIALEGKYYDVVCDNLAYCSNDVRGLLDAVS